MGSLVSPCIPLAKDKNAAYLQALVDQQGHQIEVLKQQLLTLQGEQPERSPPNEKSPEMKNAT